MRALIVNADDFGMSASVNAGIVEAHEHGVVTSATLMVRAAGAEQAGQYARRAPRLSVGLHLDLGEWVYGPEGWRARYEVVDCADRDAVRLEVDRQLARFEELVGRSPTHIDSHQHVHRNEPVSTVVGEAGRRLGVPVRHQGSVTYRGDFYGQTGTGEPYRDAITVDALLDVLDDLGPGPHELGCHPGQPDPDLVDVYRDERAIELRVLCDPRVRRALRERHIKLISFLDIS